MFTDHDEIQRIITALWRHHFPPDQIPKRIYVGLDLGNPNGRSGFVCEIDGGPLKGIAIFSEDQHPSSVVRFDFGGDVEINAVIDF